MTIYLAIRFVCSDASGTGNCGYMNEHGCHIAQEQWLAWKQLEFNLAGT